MLGEWHYHQPIHYLGSRLGTRHKHAESEDPLLSLIPLKGHHLYLANEKNRLRNQATCSLEYSVVGSGFVPMLISLGPVDGLSYDFRN